VARAIYIFNAAFWENYGMLT